MLWHYARWFSASATGQGAPPELEPTAPRRPRLADHGRARASPCQSRFPTKHTIITDHQPLSNVIFPTSFSSSTSDQVNLALLHHPQHPQSPKPPPKLASCPSHTDPDPITSYSFVQRVPSPLHHSRPPYHIQHEQGRLRVFRPSHRECSSALTAGTSTSASTASIAYQRALRAQRSASLSRLRNSPRRHAVATRADPFQAMPRASDVDMDLTHGERIEVK
jgi:hypothetical protein